MPKFIVTGDTHLRDGPYPDDLENGLRLLKDLAVLARENDTNTIILNGDVWHQKNNPSSLVLLSLYQTLYEIKKGGIHVIWVRGNHESPLRTDPHHTLMHLFSSVCHTATRPWSLEGKDYVIWLLPWYPGKEFRRLLAEVGKRALTERRKKIIIAHIGVKEGVVSPSNYRINQEVGTEDFSPGIFDLVLLGDYHASQRLLDNVIYLGAPTPHTFGDFDIVGPWLLDVGDPEMLHSLVLPSVYPSYDTYRILKEEHVVLPFYNQNNRNRIQCAMRLAGRVKAMYPDAAIEYIEDKSIEFDTGRLEGVRESDWRTVFREFHAAKGWDDKHLKMGLEYLDEAASS